MAMIVQLSSYSRKGNTPKPVVATGAEIVLFPGIRYERWDDRDEMPTASKSRRRRARKTAASSE